MSGRWKIIHVSTTLRIELTGESASGDGVEGGVIVHKWVPVVIKFDGGFRVAYAPMISGWLLGRLYQCTLARMAYHRGLPVCPLCLECRLLKHSTTSVIEELASRGDAAARLLSSKRLTGYDAEAVVAASCIVEDVGGFSSPPLRARRSSRVRFSHAVASLDTLSGRYSTIAGGAEVTSSIYTLTVSVSVDSIGVVYLPGAGWVDVTEAARRLGFEVGGGRLERVRAALHALAVMLSTPSLGARSSRSMPQWRVLSAATLVTVGFEASTPPAHWSGYMLEAAAVASRLARSIGGEWRLYYYKSSDSSDAEPVGERVVEASSVADALLSAAEYALSVLEGGDDGAPPSGG